MVNNGFEINVERYFLYRNHLPWALVSLGITAKKKAKKKKNNFIIISLRIFEGCSINGHKIPKQVI